MLPPHRLVALALYFSAAYGRPASPSDENKHGDGQALKGGQLLKDPYNPHDLVSSRIPGRRPYLPMPSTFLHTPAKWRRIQNTEYIVSQILTYDGDMKPVFHRWFDCMRLEHEKSGPGWDVWDYIFEESSWEKMFRGAAMDDHCIKTVNKEIQTEAAAKGKATYWAGRDTTAQYNPYSLESPNSPSRPPRLPHEQLPTGDNRDRLSYIADENKKDILSKLKQYDGQHPTSWEMFMDCVKKEGGRYGLTLSSYLTEQLSPAGTVLMHRAEEECVIAVNRQIDDEARRANKEAYLPVRTYAPLPQSQQAQQENAPRNEFSPASIASTWAHRAGHFLTTQSHRLELGARPLQKLVRGAHIMKMPTAPEVRAWEVDLAH
ncbi:MAG: hypothetical protein M1826_006587 [Phylliscum demangeonii]|nr:MAG: hypothetical protein M1826_006587 [Phylliscum demangeonii]